LRLVRKCESARIPVLGSPHGSPDKDCSAGDGLALESVGKASFDGKESLRPIARLPFSIEALYPEVADAIPTTER